VSSSVYADDVAALAAMRGVYHEMQKAGFASGQSSSVTVLTGTSSDEFRSFNITLNEFFNNSILSSNQILNSALWSSGYKIIYYCNSVLDGVATSSSVSLAARKQLEGEAKFIRAFTHFYLTNLFGDVPLVVTSDYRVNAVSVRNLQADVYSQIIKDLTEAQALLTNDYQFSGNERVRVNSFAASALLARAYLYTNNWEKAESYATSVINSTALYRIVNDPAGVFLKNSNEAIWQLMPVVTSQNTNEAQYFVPLSVSSLPGFVSLTDNIVNSFEPGDKRKTNWTGNQTVSGTTFYYPFKYKAYRAGSPLTEYSMVLRLAEQYLIRAEARTKQNKFSDAMTDIDIIRTRAGLGSIQVKIPSPSMDNVMTAIEQERNAELFSEWGHRWFDLKRWNRADAVLRPIKIGWSQEDMLYPIPQIELTNNPNLKPQNPGY